MENYGKIMKSEVCWMINFIICDDIKEDLEVIVTEMFGLWIFGLKI